MIVSKMALLKPLIDSKDGLHLTAYLTNGHNIFHLRKQLREALDSAYEYLAPVLSPEALVRFLAPVHNALDDTRLLKSFRGNVGIFRSANSFRILSLPVEVEQTCVVATSFHVKPLLRWMQMDREFLLLGIGDGSASLYQGDMHTMSLVDTVIFPSPAAGEPRSDSYEALKVRGFRRLSFANSIEWMNEWLDSLTKETKPQLFVAGPSDLTEHFIEHSRYAKTRTTSVWPSFSQARTPEICAEIRGRLKKEARKALDQTMVEFYHADDLNLACKNLFQIAKAVLKGKVRKLIIADGVHIFGKIDRNTGGLAVHPAHLDHEDDDLLDDLAQEVLARGGEVIVAAREEIPQSRPILAILDRPDLELSRSAKTLSNEGKDSERRAL